MSLRPSRKLAALTLTGMGAVALTAAMMSPVSAATPIDPESPFNRCPIEQITGLVANGVTIDGQTSCISALTTGGSFQIGKTVVPITAPSSLQMGSYTDTASGDLVQLPPADGSIFVSSPLPIPGGLLGIAGLDNVLPSLTGVTATVELASTTPPDVDIIALYTGGVVVSLPVKIHLKNPVLGSTCYLGTDAKPIVLNLSAGTTDPPAPNQPITGASGSITAEQISGVTAIAARGSRLVDNSFAVPEATGCGLGGLLNGVVNAKQGLPSPAGTNTAILEQDSFLGGPVTDIVLD